jgi:activator of 2-hydroxyglutaryl-CoA dehydratase
MSLERRLQVKVEDLGMDPQVIGALGAAVIAARKAGSA